MVFKIKAMHAENPAYFVLSDAYFPGWKAYVDGKETPILKANYLARAVRVPAKTQYVEFRYEPRMYSIGRAITLCALIVVCAIFVLEYAFKRRTGK